MFLWGEAVGDDGVALRREGGKGGGKEVGRGRIGRRKACLTRLHKYKSQNTHTRKSKREKEGKREKRNIPKKTGPTYYEHDI